MRRLLRRWPVLLAFLVVIVPVGVSVESGPRVSGHGYIYISADMANASVECEDAKQH